MKNLIFPVFAILALSSCTHHYYLPASPNVPLLKEKNEVHAVANMGTSEQLKSMQFQGAFGITNHVAVAGSFLTAEGGKHENFNFGKGEYKDISLGYFHTCADQQIVFDVYAGFGTSFQTHQYSALESSRLTYHKIFVQPSCGFSNHYIDFAFTPSIARMQFQNISTNLNADHHEYLAIRGLMEKRTSYLFEPTLTMRCGWKYVKIQTQLTTSKNLTHPKLPFEDYQFNVGVSFAFAQRMLKKNKPVSNKDSKRRSKNLNDE
jgi:hypothetical protein